MDVHNIRACRDAPNTITDFMQMVKWTNDSKAYSLLRSATSQDSTGKPTSNPSEHLHLAHCSMSALLSSCCCDMGRRSVVSA